MSRLECVPCRAMYVLPFVDRSLGLPFLFLLRFKVYSFSVPDTLFAKSVQYHGPTRYWLFDSIRFVMRCIFSYRSGAQFRHLRQHRNPQARRHRPQTQLCPGSLTPQRGHVQPGHRQSSSTHRTQRLSCFLSRDRTALSRLSIRTQSVAFPIPASPRQAMINLQLAQKTRRRHQVELLEALPSRQDLTISQRLQAVPLLLRMLLRKQSPVISP